MYVKTPSELQTDLSLRDMVLNQKIESPEIDEDVLYPFPNVNALKVYHLHINSDAVNTAAYLADLQQIIGDPSFSPADVSKDTANFQTLADRLDSILDNNDSSNPYQGGGWRTSKVTIHVPMSRHEPVPFCVDNFRHRSLMSVLRDAVSKVRKR